MKHHADDRPRIHLWPQNLGWRWSLGPLGGRASLGAHQSAGAALDAALSEVKAGAGAVVILEPVP